MLKRSENPDLSGGVAGFVQNFLALPAAGLYNVAGF
jgi:hypothetical protein